MKYSKIWELLSGSSLLFFLQGKDMPKFQAAYQPDHREVLIQKENAAAPGGYVDIGSFDHPDLVYPDSTVIYHAVRDLLYKRSHAEPANPAMFPENITDMHNIKIIYAEGLMVDDEEEEEEEEEEEDNEDGGGDD